MVMLIVPVHSPASHLMTCTILLYFELVPNPPAPNAHGYAAAWCACPPHGLCCPLPMCWIYCTVALLHIGTHRCVPAMQNSPLRFVPGLYDAKARV